MMKGLSLILLSIAVAAQGRHTDVQSAAARSLATAGSNPWLVHLRIAEQDSGALVTCAGSLIGPSWVLTTASCIERARFIWNRFGTLNVLNPQLVLEAGPATVHVHPEYNSVVGDNNIAFIQFNRYIHSTDAISPVRLEAAGSELPASGSFCAFGEDNGAPGDLLSCYDVELESQGNLALARSEDGRTTTFDVGAPLIANGVQVGFLVSPPGPNDQSAGIFLRVGDYVPWLEEMTGYDLDGSDDADSLVI